MGLLRDAATARSNSLSLTLTVASDSMQAADACNSVRVAMGANPSRSARLVRVVRPAHRDEVSGCAIVLQQGRVLTMTEQRGHHDGGND